MMKKEKYRKLGWRELSEKLAHLLLLGGALATAMSLLARRHWLLETAVHFRLQYLLALLLAAIILLLRRRHPAALLALLLAMPNLLPMLPYYTQPVSAAMSEESYRVLMMNVLYENEAYEDVLMLIEESEADFVVLVEMSASWEQNLLPRLSGYPHVHHAHTDWRYRTYLLSRHPFAPDKAETIGSKSRPAVTAVFELNGKPFRLIGAHPTSPSREWRVRSRNLELELLGNDIATAAEPTVLVGDLNITPFSPYFADFLRQAGLENGRYGFGLQPSWPSWMPLFRIPIDHGLVTSDITVNQFQAAPANGSDHHPIIVDFSLN